MVEQVVIRPYRDEDAPMVRRSFIELQDHEHELAPDSPTGEAIADAYLAWMHRQCRENDGIVGVARIDDEAVGFVTLLRRVEGDPDDSVPVHAYVSELAVNAAWRGRGIGAAMLRWAEGEARRAGAPELRISAVAVNAGARRLYERTGFEPIMVQYAKSL